MAGREEIAPTYVIGATTKGLQHLLVLFQDHGRHSRLENASFLVSDRRESVSENLRVLEVDERDARRDGRIDHVRAVKPTSHSHFQNNNVHLLQKEVPEGNQRQKTEEARPRGDVLRTILLNKNGEDVPCEP